MPSNKFLIVVGIIFALFTVSCFALVNSPCAEEDSLNCVWDAQTMGNGEGQSFIALGFGNFYTQIVLND